MPIIFYESCKNCGYPIFALKDGTHGHLMFVPWCSKPEPKEGILDGQNRSK